MAKVMKFDHNGVAYAYVDRLGVNVQSLEYTAIQLVEAFNKQLVFSPISTVGITVTPDLVYANLVDITLTAGGGYAKRDRRDKFDLEFGLKIALRRAVKDLYRSQKDEIEKTIDRLYMVLADPTKIIEVLSKHDDVSF